MSDETYEGWTNRETWAVKLHWDNNEGDYHYFTAQAKTFKEAGETTYAFADFLKARAEEIKDMVMEGDARQEAKDFIDDVGSLWRVDWVEIAEAYYNEVE